ncbi:hypothetical protein [Andreprevotia sp. IGB-42]|uniref:hypothetical protein n=1 Tax=Andreprevotia sp. IGB-42 TaxID=2497473 RepID=UPI0013577946|nr:hypothetical protein [Andreprevotia sp. IGB-42]
MNRTTMGRNTISLVLLLAIHGSALAAHPLRWTGSFHCDEDKTFRITTNVEGQAIYLRWLGKPYVLNDRGSTEATFDWQGSGYRWQGSLADSTLLLQGSPVAQHCRRGSAKAAASAPG